jgi:hypothetical protein
MTIIVKIPDEFAGQLVPPGQDPSRAVLEAIALRITAPSCLTRPRTWHTIPRWPAGSPSGTAW